MAHLRDDILITEEAWITRIVVVQISFQPLQNLFQRGRLRALRAQRGRKPNQCNKRNGRGRCFRDHGESHILMHTPSLARNVHEWDWFARYS